MSFVLFIIFINSKSAVIILDSTATFGSLQVYREISKGSGQINTNKRQWAIVKPINETNFGMYITGLLKIKTESDILNLSSVFNTPIASNVWKQILVLVAVSRILWNQCLYHRFWSKCDPPLYLGYATLKSHPIFLQLQGCASLKLACLMHPTIRCKQTRWAR